MGRLIGTVAAFGSGMLPSCCDARCSRRRRSAFLAHRSQPLAQVAVSAPGGTPFAPQIFTGFASSNVTEAKKTAVPDGTTVL